MIFKIAPCRFDVTSLVLTDNFVTTGKHFFNNLTSLQLDNFRIVISASDTMATQGGAVGRGDMIGSCDKDSFQIIGERCVLFSHSIICY